MWTVKTARVLQHENCRLGRTEFQLKYKNYKALTF